MTADSHTRAARVIPRPPRSYHRSRWHCGCHDDRLAGRPGGSAISPILFDGGVSERPKEHASKACEVKASEGSNPSATASPPAVPVEQQKPPMVRRGLFASPGTVAPQGTGHSPPAGEPGRGKSVSEPGRAQLRHPCRFVCTRRLSPPPERGRRSRTGRGWGDLPRPGGRRDNTAGRGCAARLRFLSVGHVSGAAGMTHADNPHSRGDQSALWRSAGMPCVGPGVATRCRSKTGGSAIKRRPS